MGWFRSSNGGKSADVASSPVRQNSGFASEPRTPSPSAKSIASYYEQKAATSAALQAELESVKHASKRNASTSRGSGICAPGRVWMHLLTATQIGIALAIIGVVYGGLMETQSETPSDGGAPVSTTVCYATSRSVNACAYSIWAAGASIVLSVVISLMNVCCPRRNAAFCLSVEAILGLVGSAWWLAAGITAVIFASEADNDNLPKGDLRTVVWILCFANAVAFAFSFLSSTFSCCAACCGVSKEDDMV